MARRSEPVPNFTVPAPRLSFRQTRQAGCRLVALATGAIVAIFVGDQSFVSGQIGFQLDGRADSKVAMSGLPVKPVRPITYQIPVEEVELPHYDIPSDEEILANADEWHVKMNSGKPHEIFPEQTMYPRARHKFIVRQKYDEAHRMLPYLQPLIERQLSKDEIAFVLNRFASKLRHLLFRPPLGLPVFTARSVFNMCMLIRTEHGPRLHNFIRERDLPRMAPGAPYKQYGGDVFAVVPPLKPWSPKDAGQKAIEA